MWNSTVLKYFSHNIVHVFVHGVAYNRSMDKRVCGQLSENFWNLLGRLQLESPSFVVTNAASAQSIEHVLAHGRRNGA